MVLPFLRLGYTLKYNKFLKWINDDLQFVPPGTAIKTFSKGEGTKREEFTVRFER